MLAQSLRGKGLEEGVQCELFPLCCTKRRVALPCVEPHVCGHGPPALSSFVAAIGEPLPARLDRSPLAEPSRQCRCQGLQVALVGGVKVQQYLQCWAL
ncbi:hypothetical protein AAFF_G00377220 [Aldrovandia affinis]|uniref:Uncharacterized protein n=1 Tax=Aldrovandia affinis TaxID=143900 RepID=A0AAD7SHV9_9TELE|nr:hypothetical protein AAFF_G00377220 [Aldrovandia affinis]